MRTAGNFPSPERSRFTSSKLCRGRLSSARPRALAPMAAPVAHETAHEEGGYEWSVATTFLRNANANVRNACVRVGPRPSSEPVRVGVYRRCRPGSDRNGIPRTVKSGARRGAGPRSEPTRHDQTDGVHEWSRRFCRRRPRRGQSLVVWAISESRRAAQAVDEFFKGCNCPFNVNGWL